MADYITRFKALADEIEKSSSLELLDFKTYPPATDHTFKSVEKEIGAKLAKSIRDFYSETNGLKLHWRVKQDIDKKNLEKLRKKYDDYPIKLPEDKDNPFAQINIIPLEETFIAADWSDVIVPLGDLTFEFRGVTHLHADFAKRLKPFDLFSAYECMAFLLEEGVGDPKVLLLSNYYVEWDYSRITDFASYIEMLLVSRGIARSREKIYQEYRGDLKPPLITGPNYWTEEHVPKMFRK